MAGKDYYSVLGVARTASDKEIKQAYRRLARRHHPDVNPGDAAAERRFKEINAAYEVLSDPEKRRQYDQYGDQWEHAAEFARARQAYGRGRPGTTTTNGGGFPFDDLLGGIFGRGAPRSGPQRGADLEQATEVSLEEAFSGTLRVFEVQSERPCASCQGSGLVAAATCAACRGRGRVARPRRIEVRLPPGVATGSRVRVAGEGQPGAGGGLKGDLFVVVTVRNHERFTRSGDDLSVDLPVPLVTAVLGGEVHLATMKGTVALTIKPETQNGQTIRLGGLGMPHLGHPDVRGDLYVRVQVELPTKLTAEQRRLFEDLREILR